MMFYKDISHTSFMWPSLFQLISFTCPILLQIKWQTCQEKGRYFPEFFMKWLAPFSFSPAWILSSTWNTIIKCLNQRSPTHEKGKQTPDVVSNDATGNQQKTEDFCWVWLLSGWLVVEISKGHIFLRNLVMLRSQDRGFFPSSDSWDKPSVYPGQGFEA